MNCHEKTARMTPTDWWASHVDGISLQEERRRKMDAEGVDATVGLAKDRTKMARFRTQLALDRTNLAWIRTALTMATFGFGTVAFFRSLKSASPTPEAVRLHQNAIAFGVALIVLGIGATVMAAISHWLALRRLHRGEMPVLSRWPLSLTIALLLAMIGLASLYRLLAS